MVNIANQRLSSHIGTPRESGLSKTAEFTNKTISLFENKDIDYLSIKVLKCRKKPSGEIEICASFALNDKLSYSKTHEQLYLRQINPYSTLFDRKNPVSISFTGRKFFKPSNVLDCIEKQKLKNLVREVQRKVLEQLNSLN